MVAFVINGGSLRPDQTTTRLMQVCLEEGEPVIVTDVFSLSVASPTDLRAAAVSLDASHAENRGQLCRAANGRKPRVLDLMEHSLVMLRTSPGRDIAHAWAHRLCLEVCHLAARAGAMVVNDPAALQHASSKLYSACLPRDLTPATLVTHRVDETRAFLRELKGPAVIKPLLGSGGRDVLFVEGPDAPNLREMCVLLGRTGYFVVQEFLPAAATGDFRVIVLDGEILTVGGRECVVNRVPRGQEFRSNVALGARAQPAELDAGQRDNALRVAQVLHQDGIRFAGLDLVGDRVVEVNVYSAGGLVDAESFYGQSFATRLIRTLLGRPD